MAHALIEAVRGKLEALTARRTPVRSGADLQAFLAAEAAHLAQSAIYDYLRARAGRFAPQLFREQPFLEALETTRWEGFAAVLADLVVVTHNALRPASCDGAALSAALAAVYRSILAEHPAPAHRGDGWRSHEAALVERLRGTPDGPPPAPDVVARQSGMAIFGHLPLHPDVRKYDEEMVVNNVGFRMLRSWETFKDRVDVAAVAADLTAAGTKPR